MNLIHCSPTTFKLRDQLQICEAVAVINGSFYSRQEVGICVWIVSRNDGTEWIEGGGVVLGQYEEQSAYHSEFGGTQEIT